MRSIGVQRLIVGGWVWSIGVYSHCQLEYSHCQVEYSHCQVEDGCGQEEHINFHWSMGVVWSTSIDSWSMGVVWSTSINSWRISLTGGVVAVP